MCPFYYYISLEKNELGSLHLIRYEYLVTVIVLLIFPHGAMGWYVVCDCGISWSYSLILFICLLR